MKYFKKQETNPSATFFLMLGFPTMIVGAIIISLLNCSKAFYLKFREVAEVYEELLMQSLGYVKVSEHPF